MRANKNDEGHLVKWADPSSTHLEGVGRAEPVLLRHVAGDGRERPEETHPDRQLSFNGVKFSRALSANVSLRAAWEETAPEFIAWARKPMHDAYWRWHRNQFLELVPSPGRLTLDIGCGEGRLSRDLEALGHTMVGIDSSPTMLRAARDAEPSIELHLADAVNLPLADGAADLAVAFMSLHDMEDLPAVVAEVGRVLEPGGRFCFAIIHPLTSAGLFETNDSDSPFTILGSYLEPFVYRDLVERDGLTVTFTSMHRPLEAYCEALAASGFLVERCLERSPDYGPGESPRDRWRQRIPLFIHMRAVRA